MSKLFDQQSDAWNCGYEDFFNGLSKEDNPYSHYEFYDVDETLYAKLYDEWLSGWLQAQADEE